MATTLALAFLAVTQSLNLPPGLLAAVCYTESGFNKHAFVPNDGGTPSHGICQVKLSTARFLGYKGSAKRLQEDPKLNIAMAGRYLNYQLTRYDGDVVKAVAAYNSGTHQTNKQGKTLNSKYVGKVFQAWAEKK